MKEITPLWFKFRDTEPQDNAELYLQYCELIQEAIGHNQTHEAFRLLAEGINWYDAAHEA